MSKRSKGMYYEHKAQEELVEEGWLVQRAPPPNRFSKQTDLFGLFDIFCLKLSWISEGSNSFFRNYKAQQRKWIQVKTNALPDKKWKEEAKKFKDNYCDCNDSVEFWTFWQLGKRKKKKGWEKERI